MRPSLDDTPQYTVLNNRVLWFDGVSAADPSNIWENLTSSRAVTHVTEEIKRYNTLVGVSDRLWVKEECDDLTSTHTWKGPLPQFENLYDRIISTHYDRFNTSPDFLDRERRLVTELETYKRHTQYRYLLCKLDWLVTWMHNRNIIWGVGRGSSVASYVLFVLEVHDIDSYIHDLDFSEFVH